MIYSSISSLTLCDCGENDENYDFEDDEYSAKWVAGHALGLRDDGDQQVELRVYED